MSRSRCPRECTRTAATQLNVYLGVTDRTAAASAAPVAVDRSVSRVTCLVTTCHVPRVTLHPGWDLAAPLNNITQGHDLALLHLAHPVTFRCNMLASTRYI